MIDLALSPEDEQKRNQTMQTQRAPLATPQAPQQQKGMGGQMMDMAKQRAMTSALDAGQGAITSGISSALAPTVASGVEGGAMLGAGGAGAGAAMATAIPYVGAGLLAGKALGLFNEGGRVGPLSAQYAADGYQIPGSKEYNIRMARNKARREAEPVLEGLENSSQSDRNFNEGMRQLRKQQDFVYPMIVSDYGATMSPTTNMQKGVARMAFTDDPIAQKMYGVGNAPLDTSSSGITANYIGLPTYGGGYTARGYDQGGSVGMTEADARALMMNQPNPDELYNEIVAENMTEAAIGTPMAMPMMRPPLGVDPLNADTTYSPYDMIRSDNASNT